MAAIVNVNGKITGERDAVISVFDHGFLYGEGVYETLRTYQQRPFLLDRHLRRLRTSAGMIMLGVPMTDDQFARRIAETIEAASAASTVSTAAPAAGATSAASAAAPAASAVATRDTEWYVRVLLTRGVGELTYDPAATPTPSVVTIVKPHLDPPAELYTNGVRATLSSIVRNHPDTVNPMIKSNNLMNCALAMQEGYRRGAFEVIMRNYRGELAECSVSNLFIVKDGVALTPPLSAGLLPGITREFVFEVGQAAGVPVREAVLRDADLYAADEVFLTGTTREIMPIVQVEDSKIGSGLPGPVTKILHHTFREMAQASYLNA